MAWKNYIALMPGSIVNNRTWLDSIGSNVSHSITGAPTGSWQLLQVIPVTIVSETGSGQVWCYFISGSY